MKSEISKLNKCCPDIKSEITNLKINCLSDISNVKYDITLMKSEISGCKNLLKEFIQNKEQILNNNNEIINNIQSENININKNNNLSNINSKVNKNNLNEDINKSETSNNINKNNFIKSEDSIQIKILNNKENLISMDKNFSGNNEKMMELKSDKNFNNRNEKLIELKSDKNFNNNIGNIIELENDNNFNNNIGNIIELENDKNFNNNIGNIIELENNNNFNNNIGNMIQLENKNNNNFNNNNGNIIESNFDDNFDDGDKNIISIPKGNIFNNKECSILCMKNDNNIKNKEENMIKILTPSNINKINDNMISLQTVNNLNNNNENMIVIQNVNNFNNKQEKKISIETNKKYIGGCGYKKCKICYPDNNNEEEEDPNLKLVIISMEGKNFTIKVNINSTLEQFKSIVINYFNITNNTLIYYFNEYGVKKMIKTENDFKESFKQKLLKYYFLNENAFVPIKEDKKNEKNNDEITFTDFSLNEFYKICNPNYISIYPEKIEIKELIKHFSSISYISADIGKGDFIKVVVKISNLMNKLNSIEKDEQPDKFHNIDEILKYPGLLSQEFTERDKLYILALISKTLIEKGINASIPKDNKNDNNLDLASLQYLFNGFTEKKKYEIKFDLENKKNEILLQKGDELNKFIEEWKNKISNQLNIDKNEIYLVNPNDKEGLCLDLVTNNGNIDFNKLKNFAEIKNIEEKPLIEGCQLSTDIFDPNYKYPDSSWGINETIGGEKYIPPLGWFGYRLNVSKKYDNGNDTWLDHNDNKGVFAIAYLGLSNIYQNQKKLEQFLNEINSEKVLKMGYEQIYKDDINIKTESKNEYDKCGNGVYLFQDPNIAENTASIIDICGVRYKILIMCRVNPNKIRQPNGFKDCWILNPTPSEVRPYRILIKIIFQSPMAGASQNEIKVFDSSPDYFKDIIAKKDITFLRKNKLGINNDDFVINLYTSNDYKYINNYLREGKIDKNSKYTEKEIKSWVWCLHKALTTRKSNVKNGSIFYRGVGRKFPKKFGKGYKFIFSEFTSVSEDKKVALSFAKKGTLFEVRIEKNDYSHYYCYKIDKISKYPKEKETLITTNCIYQITNNEFDFKNSVDIIYLTCEGYQNK